MTDHTGEVPDLANLAEHVRTRRAELDMTQLDVWNAGGPSNSTLTAIEAERPPAPSRSTLRKLDHALRWTPGSAKNVLSGGRPSPVDGPKVNAQQTVDELSMRANVLMGRLVAARELGADAEELADLERQQNSVDAALFQARTELARLTEETARNDAVGAASKDADSLLYRRPDGVSDQEWERIRDQSRDYIEWLIDKAARER